MGFLLYQERFRLRWIHLLGTIFILNIHLSKYSSHSCTKSLICTTYLNLHKMGFNLSVFIGFLLFLDFGGICGIFFDGFWSYKYIARSMSLGAKDIWSYIRSLERTGRGYTGMRVTLRNLLMITQTTTLLKTMIKIFPHTGSFH